MWGRRVESTALAGYSGWKVGLVRHCRAWGGVKGGSCQSVNQWFHYHLTDTRCRPRGSTWTLSKTDLLSSPSGHGGLQHVRMGGSQSWLHIGITWGS